MKTSYSTSGLLFSFNLLKYVMIVLVLVSAVGYALGLTQGGTDGFSLSPEYGATSMPGALLGLAAADTSMFAELSATGSVANRLDGNTDLIP